MSRRQVYDDDTGRYISEDEFEDVDGDEMYEEEEEMSYKYDDIQTLKINRRFDDDPVPAGQVYEEFSEEEYEQDVRTAPIYRRDHTTHERPLYKESHHKDLPTRSKHHSRSDKSRSPRSSSRQTREKDGPLRSRHSLSPLPRETRHENRDRKSSKSDEGPSSSRTRHQEASRDFTRQSTRDSIGTRESARASNRSKQRVRESASESTRDSTRGSTRDSIREANIDRYLYLPLLLNL